MRSPSLVAAVSILLITAACGDTPSESPGTHFSIEGVEVERVAEGVRITNGTDQPLAYAVWASGFLGLFAPCTDTSPECARLAPAQSVIVLPQEITGMWEGETEAIVRWWRVVPDSQGGYRAEGLREVVVTL